jgi:hypothetical protein
MEVLMKKIIGTLITFSFLTMAAVLTTNAQFTAVKVKADIPFDFSIGKRSFQAGKYDLKLVRNVTGVYSVTLIDQSDKQVHSTLALKGIDLNLKASDMVFAVANGHRYLKEIRMPELTCTFNMSIPDNRTARVEKVAIPTSGAPQL